MPFLGEQWGRPGKLRLVAWWVPTPQPMTGAVTAGVSRYGASKNRRAFQSTSQWGRGDSVGQMQYSRVRSTVAYPGTEVLEDGCSALPCPPACLLGLMGVGSNELWYLVILDSQ